MSPTGPALASQSVLAMDVLGTSLQVEVFEEALRQVGDLLADFPQAAQMPTRALALRLADGPSDRLCTLYDDEQVVRNGMALHEAVSMLLWQVNQVALGTSHYAVVHAGCVAWGRVGVVLSAPMEAGKSTLVTSLVTQGFSYLSDEFAAISFADDMLHPHPAPIALDAGSFSLFPLLEPACADTTRWHLRAEDVRPKSLAGPVRPGAIVFPRYVPGQISRVEAITPKQALVSLVDQALNLRSIGGQVFRALASLVGSVPSHRLVFSDLDDACATIVGLTEAAKP